MKPNDIISAIEEYRRAFWEHRDLTAVKTKKYVPLVMQDHTTSSVNGSIFYVALHDSWIDDVGSYMDRKPIVKFGHRRIEEALHEMLDYTRSYFVDDGLFDKI